MLEEVISREIKDFKYKDYYRFRVSFTWEKNFLFLFINTRQDSLNNIEKEIKRFKAEFFNLIKANSFNFTHEKSIEQIDNLTYLVQNRMPPIISLIGYSGVGKSTIFNLLRSKDISIESQPVISGKIGTLKVGKIYFLMRSFVGDEKIGFLWNNFIRGSDAILLITDSTQKNIENSKFFLSKFEEEVPYAYIGGIGNKQDIENAEDISKIKDVLGLNPYSMIATKPQNREKLILMISEILEMKNDILQMINILFKKEKLIKELELAIKNENNEDLKSFFDKIIYLSLKLGDNLEPIYRMQLKLKEGVKETELFDLQPRSKIRDINQETSSRSLSALETRLKLLLKNFMNEVEGIVAITICDREGLIITSEKKGDAGDETVVGAIAASVDSYIERIKKEFKEQTTFFNITAIGNKKFAYCSMGLKSILLTISDLSSTDTELRIYSEHIAAKIEMLLEGNTNVSLQIPDIIKILSKTKDGKIPTGDYSLKLILTGDYEVGKTSLIMRFIENIFKESYQSTVGVEISKKTIEIEKNTKINFVIWDIGGQITQMTPFRKRFYGGANAAFIVIDRTRSGSLKSIEKWYKEISKYVRGDMNFIVVANKSDLEEKISVSEEEIKMIANRLGFHYILTSAKTGENVNELFLYIAYRYLESVA
ncbi:MAG: ADP-ribosylation factor-like protein [Promethearchaeota archaeon]|jgi:small GTP-binding protein